MAVNLVKSEKINLSKAAPGLAVVRAGLGWAPGAGFDLDVSVFGLTSAAGSPKLVGEEWLVYFNNKSSPGNAIVHSGDNLTGDGDGDDETIKVDLAALAHAPAVDEISIIVNIYDAVARNQHFGDVKDAYIKIYNDKNGEVLAEYKLTENFTSETAVQVGSFFKNGAEWEFQAVGAGFNKDLGDFVAIYQ